MSNYATSYISLIIILVIITFGWGASSGAFQVTILVSSPDADKGSSSAILNTFKGIGGMITPIIGGYFLTKATNKISTINKAFSRIFIIASLLLLLADFLLILVTFYQKIKAKIRPQIYPYSS